MPFHKEDISFGSEDKKGHPFLKALLALFILAVFLVIICFVFSSVNNARVSFKKTTVTVPQLSGNFSILHISDLHGREFGAAQSRMGTAWGASASKISAVCITGDMTGKDGDCSAFCDMLDRLPGTDRIYFISGDEDPDPILSSPHDGDSPYAPWVLEAQAHGAIYLDCPTDVRYGKSTVWFCPEEAMNTDTAARRRELVKVQQSWEQKEPSEERDAMLLYLEYWMDLLSRIDDARSRMSASDIYIVLKHAPYRAEKDADMKEEILVRGVQTGYRASLVLCGHLCGGQVRLPLIGAVRIPSRITGEWDWFPDEKEVSGLSYVNGVFQYISPGLGTCSRYTLPMRVFCAPQVDMITLTNELSH